MFIFFIIAITIILLAMELDYPIDFPFDLILAAVALYCIAFSIQFIEKIASWLKEKSPLFRKFYDSYQKRKIIIYLFALLLLLIFLLIGLSL